MCLRLTVLFRPIVAFTAATTNTLDDIFSQKCGIILIIRLKSMLSHILLTETHAVSTYIYMDDVETGLIHSTIDWASSVRTASSEGHCLSLQYVIHTISVLIMKEELPFSFE